MSFLRKMCSFKTKKICVFKIKDIIMQFVKGLYGKLFEKNNVCK